MIFWIAFILLIYTPYLIWANKIHQGWIRSNENNIEATGINPVGISIIIPFRNESEIIQHLIDELVIQTKAIEEFEIILVNDHSTDNSSDLVEQLIQKETHFELLQSDGLGKKQALTIGINHAKHDWIVTLDADVSLPTNWTKYISRVCANANVDMIILPVQISPSQYLFQKIEALEFYAMQAITFGYASMNKSFLANGAHLAFRKKSFLELNGYQNHLHMSSGDDVFLLEQMMLSPRHQIGHSYYQDMIVSTYPSRSIIELIHQKIRWGSKSFKFKSEDAKKSGILIILGNVSLLILLFFGPWKILLLAFIVKALSDFYLVLFPIPKEKRKSLLIYIPLFMIIYPFYITFVGIASLLIKPRWKGRKV